MKPLASLSLDLDNQWSYMKTHGDPGWERFPSYLDRLVPLALELLARLDLRITFFVVGQDAARPENREALASIRAAGHEIANHSFHHEPWLHTYTAARVSEEFSRSEDAIEAATGVRTTGFRGPGYSVSTCVLNELVARGYRYDASTLPTWIGPVARAYYFMTARLEQEEREDRAALFGGVRDALRPIKPYRWQLERSTLLEIPVTTMPFTRVPIHLSYVLYLCGYSESLASTYFSSALSVCRLAGVEPSILLHPLDFLGADDVDALAFFPGMNLTGSRKRASVFGALEALARRFRIVPMGAHAESICEREGLPLRAPDFALESAAARLARL